MTTTPGPELKDMLGPGQEDIFDDFVKEVEEEQSAINQAETQEQPETDEELIGGKFKNVDEVLKAYQEAERKLSEGKQETQETPQPYTDQQVTDFFGEDLVNKVKEQGLDINDISFRADQGQDISEHYDALAQATGFSKQVIENYVRNAKGAAPAPQNTQTGDNDYSNIVNTVGGAEDYKAMTDWMTKNLSESELTSFNNAVDANQSYAQKLQTVTAMKARYDLKNGGGEPKLIQGGSATANDVFDSKDQAVAAISAIDKATGRRRYDVDPKYRKWVETTMNRSNQSIFDS
jgi:hypothetical protein